MKQRATASVGVRHVDLSAAVGGSGHRTNARQAIELRLRTKDGVGLGEAAPLPGFSAESFDQALKELTALGELNLKWPDSPEDCREVLEAQLRASSCCVPSARFALEVAWLDLASKHYAVPLAQLLATLSRASGFTGELRLSKLLNVESSAWLTAASQALTRGYRTLKLKLGIDADFDREIEHLLVLREHVGSAVQLRLDPNRGWAQHDVAERLERVARVAPELVEEPAPLRQLAGLASSPVPLAIDESLQSPDALEVIAECRERIDVQAVVVKPALLGMLPSLDIARSALDLGLQVIVTHAFDGPIGHAAAASLALAIGSRDRAHGLAPHAGLLLAPGYRLLGVAQGMLRAVSVPGLPLEIGTPC
jgi:o-succinylbenzoate synthase